MTDQPEKPWYYGVKWTYRREGLHLLLGRVHGPSFVLNAPVGHDPEWSKREREMHLIASAPETAMQRDEAFQILADWLKVGNVLSERREIRRRASDLLSSRSPQ